MTGAGICSQRRKLRRNTENYLHFTAVRLPFNYRTRNGNGNTEHENENENEDENENENGADYTSAPHIIANKIQRCK